MMNDNLEKNPLVSVIMPVYNGAATLGRAVGSVRGQTSSDWELVLVDDGSTDQSPAICDDYAKDAPERIRVIHKENEGLMRAWLDGVKISAGRYLCFVDCDDWIDADMLERMTAELKPADSADFSPGQVVCCGYLIEYGGGKTPKPVGHRLPPGVYEGRRLDDDLKRELLGHERRSVIPSRCMKLIDRKLILDNIRFLDTTIHMGEDVNITIPVLLDAGRVVLLNDPLYHYAFVQGSMVHRYDPELYADCVKLRDRLSAVLDDKGIPENLEERGACVRREFLILFLQVLKNEVRRTGHRAFRDSKAHIKKLCRDEDSASLLEAFPEKLDDPANRLLSVICKKPTALRIAAVRFIFSLYEKFR